MVRPFLQLHMRLQQVATTWTCKTNTLLVIKLVGLDISCIVVAKIWLEWTKFLLVVSDLAILVTHIGFYSRIQIWLKVSDGVKSSTIVA